MRVAILTPMRHGTCHHAFTESLALTLRSFKNMDIAWFKTIGCTILPDARSMCLAQALAWGADKVVFIDDDMSWTPADFRWLISHKVKVCTGLYPQRKVNDEDPLMLTVKFLGNEIPSTTADDGLIEVDFSGFGFFCIDRDVFETLRPKTQKMHSSDLTSAQLEHFRDWFPYGFKGATGDLEVPATRSGEDTNFCRRARELGFPVYLDPSINLGHHDGAREYRVTGLITSSKETL